MSDKEESILDVQQEGKLNERVEETTKQATNDKDEGKDKNLENDDNNDNEKLCHKSENENENEIDQSEDGNALNAYSDEHNIDEECERLLRNTKKQVKQMMEEAVTKKFIHEESSSIISLCVSVDACLSHGLKRRALGLFRTSSSTALFQKVAKCCQEAQEVLELVNAEERKMLSEQQDSLKRAANLQQQFEQNQNQNQQIKSNNSNLNVKLNTLQNSRATPPIKHVASNLEVHRRNLWIKCALIEKKLVPIVEYLSIDAGKYYEPEALMSNYLCAQILASLLIGPSALEFSRSKTNDYYQFDDPTADELLRRHKLTNPIACLCSNSSNQHDNNNSNLHNQLARSKTEGGGEVGRTNQKNASSSRTKSLKDSVCKIFTQQQQQEENNNSLENNDEISSDKSQNDSGRSTSPIDFQNQDYYLKQQQQQISINGASKRSNKEQQQPRRRRPLALKTSVKRGTLVTDCHHYNCQEISEHQQTRGYSFLSTHSNGISPFQHTNSSTNSLNQQTNLQSNCYASNGNNQNVAACNHAPAGNSCQASLGESWSLWSPRMLHETLHQNPRSRLLYAKNNVLLETQPHQFMAGYLSLQETSFDLILKWIPNQMINGGQANDHNCSNSETFTCESCLEQEEHEEGGKDEEINNNSSFSCDNKINQITNNSTCNEQANYHHQQQQQQQQQQKKRPMAVESTYLDYVVNLPISRIVLLHCQFAPAKQIPKLIDLSANNINNNNNVCENKSTHLNGNESDSKLAFSNLSELNNKRHQFFTNEETLTLFEADGVQRAPFKFPKGGLRLFLSCLENGLKPSKYLNPAIRFDDGPDWPDPLHLGAELDSPGLSSPTTNENNTPVASRLDVLLKRLPSLKRNRQLSPKKTTAEEQATSAEHFEQNSIKDLDENSPTKLKLLPNDENNNNQNEQLSKTKDTTTSTHDNNVNFTLPASNYVYRIVSVQQQDWSLGTPPLSALSLGSSSSSQSFNLTAPIVQQTNKQHQQLQQQSSNQKFRWSLSRLTRLSSRYTNSGGSTSSASSNVCGGGGTLPPTTNGSLNSLANRTLDDSVSCDGAGEAAESFDNKTLIKSSGATSNQSFGPSCSLNNAVGDSSSDLIRIEAKLDYLKKSTSNDLLALRTQSLQTLCDSMRKQILARAFYGWLAHCRRVKIIRKHLVKLIKLNEQEDNNNNNHLQEDEIISYNHYQYHHRDVVDTNVNNESDNDNNTDNNNEHNVLSKKRLTVELWEKLIENKDNLCEKELSFQINSIVYYGGIENNELRKIVWPYLLEHYKFSDNEKIRLARDKSAREAYETCGQEWTKIDRVIKQRDNEILSANIAKAKSRNQQQMAPTTRGVEVGEQEESNNNDNDNEPIDSSLPSQSCEEVDNEDDDASDELVATITTTTNDKNDKQEDEEGGETENKETQQQQQPTAVQQNKNRTISKSFQASRAAAAAAAKRRRRERHRLESTGSVESNASITDQFGNNIHRIDKDVQRCDRNFWYFKETKNLDKLRNIMCSYVWQHLDVGYVQGMCDLAAPFLVIFDDEILAFSCFGQLMKRMVSNFPHGSSMDQHFESLKYLMQVLDPKLFEILQNNGDYTHFYFCYRWLLLDFKRELAYEDLYKVWETIWSARRIVSDNFVVFMALAMVRYYRDIIIENNMDFTDTIKFFNEMAEKHKVLDILNLARGSIIELKNLIRASI